jgi:transposase
MIAFPAGVKVWIAGGVTDMRCGMNSLALKEGLGRDPHGGEIFCFRGRRGQPSTFCIRFSSCEDRLCLAPAVWADAAGVAIPARQGSDLHLYGRAARS